LSNGSDRPTGALSRLLRGGLTEFVRPEIPIGGAVGRQPHVLAPRPVDLLRADDLLLLRCSFENLAWGGAGPDGVPVLVRSNKNKAAYLIVRFPPQHIIERAFFETAAGIEVKEPDPDKPPKTSELPPEPPPVFASIAASSFLVFRVVDQQISYSVEGLLRAMSTLELAVAPNALLPQTPLLQPWRELITAGKIDPGVLLGAAGGATGGAARRRPSSTATIDTTSEVLAFARLSRTALSLERRFGTEAAIRAVAATRIGGRLGAERVVGVGGRRLLPKPLPAAPTETQTAIELPWRLVVSPNVKGAWAHSPTAVEHDGRFELWHTRMGTRGEAAADGTPTVVEIPTTERTIRAIWARDFTEIPFPFKPNPGAGDLPKANGDDDRPRVRTSLNSRDRMMLVHETSNFQLKRGSADWVPPAVPVDRLMLSTMGGWLESRVAIPSLPDGVLSIEEWKHYAAMARDHEVKVVYAGFLLPFGHRASLVKVTERKIAAGSNPPIAYLYQRIFIIVREPEKQFDSMAVLPKMLPTDPDIRADLAMPLKSVHILTRVTPDLDLPKKLPGDNDELTLFVPYVGGAAFPFKILAVDRENNQVEYRGPLAWMDRSRTVVASLANALKGYNLLTEDRRMPLNGQRLAFADSDKPDDTTLATDALTFDARILPSPLPPQDDARFVPTLYRADVVVPAMSALAGAASVVGFEYPAAYAERGFTSNTAQVFFKTKTGTSNLEFAGQSDRSGGFVTPSLAVSGLSRLTGPIGGKVEDAIGSAGSKGQFNPAQFFAGVNAKLFGVVKLTDLLKAIDFDPSKVPTFVAQTLDVAASLADNARRLQQGVQQVEATVGTAATDLKSALTTFLNDFNAVMSAPDSPPPTLNNDLTTLATRAKAFADAVEGLATLERAEREQLAAIARRIEGQLADAAKVIGLLKQLAKGDLLPEVVSARLDWSSDIPRWPAGSAASAILSPVNASGAAIDAAKLKLAVEVQAPTSPGAEPTALVSCSISALDLRLIPPALFIILHFEKFEFSIVPGKKPDVNVLFKDPDGIEFAGPLSFVNTLKDIIPFDGFSDPPYLDVTAEGIEAGFTLAIPNLSVGIFSLENIALGAHVSVPFLDESLEFGFNFCTREDPFRLSVMLFAGGGFVGITITPDGVRVLEAALEFGAAISVNFGVASGGLSAMAGIYFKIEIVSGNDECTLTGYFRLRGEVDVLGLISASIELYLSLSYETATGSAVGRATLTIEVEVLFFSASVKIACEKKFAGAGADPTFVQQMGLRPGALPGEKRPWDVYARAFA
jgi:hypothetical protein